MFSCELMSAKTRHRAGANDLPLLPPAILLVLLLSGGCAGLPPREELAGGSCTYLKPFMDQVQLLPPDEAEGVSRAMIRRVVETNRFTTDRGLKEYTSYLGPEFTRSLARLKEDGHWLDGGSGSAYAQKDFLGSRDGHVIVGGRPRMTAITKVYPDDQPKELAGGRFRVLSGRYFEEIPTQEIPRADLITDVVGIINYSDQIDLALEKYLGLLKPDGTIYVFIPPSLTFIRRGDDTFSLIDWLRSIPGLLVREPEAPASPFPAGYVFTLRKIACGIVIPRLRLAAASHRFMLIREFQVDDGEPGDPDRLSGEDVIRGTRRSPAPTLLE
jgi:hypothetical protein